MLLVSMVSLQIMKRCTTHAGDVPDLRLTGEDEPEDGAPAETEQILANVRPRSLTCQAQSGQVVLPCCIFI